MTLAFVPALTIAMSTSGQLVYGCVACEKAVSWIKIIPKKSKNVFIIRD